MSALDIPHATSPGSSVWNQLDTTHKLIQNLSSNEHVQSDNGPQIVLVGKPGSGKTSVLEAITHIRLPAAEKDGATFTTELVLRCAEQTKVDVSVLFADRGKKAKTFTKIAFQTEELQDLVREAIKHIEYPESTMGLSGDVLQVQIGGPNLYPSTLVDLPGLHFDISDKSFQRNQLAVELAAKYMKQPDSTILAVTAANDHFLTNPVIKKIRSHDPDLERTIGVFTKPDLERGLFVDVEENLRFARNEVPSFKLELGWHVLKNKSSKDDDFKTRGTEETEFLRSGAWRSLPERDRGSANLQHKLADIALEKAQKTLHALFKDINRRIEVAQNELHDLGPTRSTPAQQRTFLLNTARGFHQLVEQGVDGRYHDPFFGGLDDTEWKLRAQLRNCNDAFQHALLKRGSKLAISTAEDVFATPAIPEHLKELIEIYCNQCPPQETISLERLHDRLEHKAAANQGRELAGSPSTDLVVRLFQDQASPWRKLALFHIQQVSLLAKAFTDQVFQHLTGKPEASPTTERILRDYVDTFFVRKEKELVLKLDELLKPYKRGYAVHREWQFERMVRNRTVDRLNDYVTKATAKPPDGFDFVTRSAHTKSVLKETVTAIEGESQGRFGIAKAVDMMQAYYDIAIGTFTSNVINLAIEGCLIADLPEVFTTAMIDDMDESEVEKLAGQSKAAQVRADHLTELQRALQKDLEECRKVLPRPLTASPLTKLSACPKSPSRPVKQQPSPEPKPASKTTADVTPASTPPTPPSTGASCKIPPPTIKSNSDIEQPRNASSSSGSLFGSAGGNNSKNISGDTQPAKGNTGIFGHLNASSSLQKDSDAVSNSKPVVTGGLFGPAKSTNDTCQPQPQRPATAGFSKFGTASPAGLFASPSLGESNL